VDRKMDEKERMARDMASSLVGDGTDVTQRDIDMWDAGEVYEWIEVGWGMQWNGDKWESIKDKVPDYIYLQAEDDWGDWSSSVDAMSWCDERINESDVMYVKASLYQAAQDRIAELEAELENYRNHERRYLVRDQDLLSERIVELVSVMSGLVENDHWEWLTPHARFGCPHCLCKPSEDHEPDCVVKRGRDLVSNTFRE
jgi:hypothetical protein